MCALGTERRLQVPDQVNTMDVRKQLHDIGPRKYVRGWHSSVLCHADRFFHSCASVGKFVGFVAVSTSKQFRRIQGWHFDFGNRFLVDHAFAVKKCHQECLDSGLLQATPLEEASEHVGIPYTWTNTACVSTERQFYPICSKSDVYSLLRLKMTKVFLRQKLHRSTASSRVFDTVISSSSPKVIIL